MDIPKAPKNWRLSPDQQSHVEGRPQLKGWSRDALYIYFQNRRGGRKAPPTPPKPKPKAPQRGGLGGALDRLLGAFGQQ